MSNANVSWIRKLSLHLFCTCIEPPSRSRSPSQRKQSRNVYTEKYIYENVSIKGVKDT